MVTQGNEESAKSAKQVPQSMGTTDPSKTGFLAPPASGASPPTLGGGDAGQTGMAAEAGKAATDMPFGIQADTSAVAHTASTGEEATVDEVDDKGRLQADKLTLWPSFLCKFCVCTWS